MTLRTTNLLLVLALLCWPNLDAVIAEDVMVQVESANVKVKGEVIGTIQRGQRFTVLIRNGAWVGVKLETETGVRTGWVHTNHLRSLTSDSSDAPAAPTALVPGVEFEVDLLQLSFDRSNSPARVRMRAKLENLGAGPLPFDFGSFKLRLAERELSPKLGRLSSNYGDLIYTGINSRGPMAIRGSNLRVQDSGELAPGESVTTWLQFEIPKDLWDKNQAKFESVSKTAVLTGLLNQKDFEIDLKRQSLEELPKEFGISKLEPTVTTVDLSGCINAFNIREFIARLPLEDNTPKAVVGIVKDTEFIIDGYALKQLGVSMPGQYPYTKSPDVFLDPPLVLAMPDSKNTGENSNRNGYGSGGYSGNASYGGGYGSSSSRVVSPYLPFATTSTDASIFVLAKHSKTHNKLLPFLKSPDATTRSSALMALTRFLQNPDVLDLLTKASLEGYESNRIAALQALSGTVNFRSFRTLSLRFSGSPAPQTAAVIEAIVRNLSDNSSSIKSTAIGVARKFDHPKVIAALIAGLPNNPREGNYLVAICDALGTLKATEAVEPLQKLRQQLGVRQLIRAPIAALEKIGTLTAAEAAIAQLNEGLPDYQSFRSLKGQKSPEVVSALISYLSGGQQGSYASQAIELLGEIGDKSAVPTLISQLKYGNSNRDRIAIALGNIGDPAAIEPLRALATTQGYPNRAILGILVQLGDMQSLQYLLAALKEPETSNMRPHEILGILGKSKHPLVPRAVARFLDGKDRTLKFSAARVLLEIGTPDALKQLERRLLAEKFVDGASLLSSLRGQRNSTTMQFLYLARESRNEQVRNAAQAQVDAFESQARAMVKSTAATIHLPMQQSPPNVEYWLGNATNLQGLNGEVVLLNFWAPWNQKSVGLLPDLSAIHDDLSSKGLKVISLSHRCGFAWNAKTQKAYRMSSNELAPEKEAMTELSETLQLLHPLGFMNEGQSSPYLRLPAFPLTVLLGRDGSVRGRYFGNDDKTIQEIRAEAERELFTLDLSQQDPDEETLAASLENLRGVRYLNLQVTAVNDEILSKIDNAQQLVSISLDGTSITNACLAGLLVKTGRSLEYFGLSGTNIDNEGIQVLCEHPGLTSLGLGAAGVDDASVQMLTKLPRLEKLSLGDGWGVSSVTDAGLKTLAANHTLKALRLNGTDVTDDGIAALEGLPNLSSLELVCTAASPEGIEQLRKAKNQLALRTDEMSNWLNEQEYQREFIIKNAQGYFPLEVHVRHSDGGIAQYRAHFLPQPTDRKFQSYSRHGIQRPGLEQVRNQYFSRGYGMVSVAGSQAPIGTKVYCATFVEGRPEAYWSTPWLEAVACVNSATKACLEDDFETAEAELKRALEFESEHHHNAYVLMAFALQEQGKIKESEPFLRRAVALIEDTPIQVRRAFSWSLLGESYYRLREYEKAKDVLVTAKNTFRDPKPLAKKRWYFLAMTLHRLGESELAQDYFRQISGDSVQPSNFLDRLALAEATKLLSP